MALARARLIFCSSWNGFRPQSGCNSIPLHVSAGGKTDQKTWWREQSNIFLM